MKQLRLAVTDQSQVKQVGQIRCPETSLTCNPHCLVSQNGEDLVRMDMSCISVSLRHKIKIHSPHRLHDLVLTYRNKFEIMRFWNATSCTLVQEYLSFWENCRLALLVWRWRRQLPPKRNIAFDATHRQAQTQSSYIKSIDTETRYGLDGPGIEFRWERDFSHPFKPTVGPTQPPVQSLTGRVPGGKA
jgi:hypothetical protein